MYKIKSKGGTIIHFFSRRIQQQILYLAKMRLLF